jgi:hypothetical protein
MRVLLLIVAVAGTLAVAAGIVFSTGWLILVGGG